MGDDSFKYRSSHISIVRIGLWVGPSMFNSGAICMRRNDQFHILMILIDLLGKTRIIYSAGILFVVPVSCVWCR